MGVVGVFWLGLGRRVRGRSLMGGVIVMLVKCVLRFGRIVCFMVFVLGSGMFCFFLRKNGMCCCLLKDVRELGIFVFVFRKEGLWV